MIRVALGLVIMAIVLAVVWAIASVGTRAARRLPKRPAAGPPISQGYEWERRTDQLYRRMKSVPGPEENREKMLGFIDSRRGVEAYVEPRTMINPLSVVLVAEDGEWIRYELKDDAFMRELARGRRLKVFDASKVGYPERMRRYRRNKGPEAPDAPGPGQDGV